MAGNSNDRISKANFLSKTVFFPFVSSLRKFENLFHVHDRNRQLTETLASQTIEINTLKKAVKKAELGISDYFELQDYEYVVAEVIGMTGDFYERNLVINKGSRNGVKENFPVITNAGVVGRVLSVFNNYSLILPYNHSQFKLSVYTSVSQTHGLLESDIFGNTYMSMIRPGSRIVIGETVTTSNISRYFPKGYEVGTVRRLETSPEQLYLRAIITPSNSIEDVEYVFVLFYEKEITGGL